MAKDFKPVNDRSLGDINAANRDAWDSGEFRHEADARGPAIQREGTRQLKGTTPAQTARSAGKFAKQFVEKGDSEKAKQHAAAAAHFGKKALGQDAADCGDEMYDENNKVIGGIGTGKGPSRLRDRSVHLPRTAKRTWRKGEWS